MKFNMGCGHNKQAGFLNVDLSPGCSPDVVYDLELLPWPWLDDVAEEIVFNHSLEHMGQDARIFLGIMKEVFRIARHRATVAITVPHPRHDNFIGDPTHVRPITPQMLCLFDKDLNDQWQKIGAANTPFAHYLGVNFKLESTKHVLDEPYASLLQAGKITEKEIESLVRERNNVVTEYRIVLRVVKPV